MVALRAHGLEGTWLPPGADWCPAPPLGCPAGQRPLGDPAVSGMPLDHCTLVSSSFLACGDIVSAPRQLGIVGGPGPPFEVTFDGGARAVGGRRVAGAGAVLWAPGSDGGPSEVSAVAAVALSGERYAPRAEAEGCAAPLTRPSAQPVSLVIT